MGILQPLSLEMTIDLRALSAAAGHEHGAWMDAHLGERDGEARR